MSTQNMESFEEKLIENVKIRKLIYDKSNPDHSRKHLITKAWKDISEETGESGILFFLKL